MKFRVVFLASAEEDLKDLRDYIVKKFGAKAWQISYVGIKDSVRALQSFPLAGGIPDEIRNLNLTQFRQVISGKNRIIYEVRPNGIFVHAICDTRKDIRALMKQRVSRAP